MYFDGKILLFDESNYYGNGAKKYSQESENDISNI